MGFAQGLEYIYRGKNLLAQADPENEAVSFYHTNYLDAAHQLTDVSGTMVWEAIYLPFGKAVVAAGSSVTNNWRLPGQYFDGESGLYYNYHRYYDPGTGRYMTPDPIGLEGGSNLYAYVKNNPVNSIDPYGLARREECGQVHVDFVLGASDEILSQFDFVRSMAMQGPDILSAWQTSILASLLDTQNNALADLWGVEGSKGSKAYWAGRVAVIIAAIYASAESTAANSLPKVKKAVNSNMQHAISRAVEHGVFADAESASNALKALSKSIGKEGFPANAIFDTARADRVLVPIGDKGMAVYQIAKNLTAKLKTVLIEK